MDFQGTIKVHQTHQKAVCFTRDLTTSPYNMIPWLFQSVKKKR